MTGNPNYRRGVAFERELAAWAAEQGWIAVRAAGSKGPVDLIILRDMARRPIGLQVKANAWPGPAERRALAQLHNYYVIPMAVRRHPRTRGVWQWARISHDAELIPIEEVQHKW